MIFVRKPAESGKKKRFPLIYARFCLFGTLFYLPTQGTLCWFFQQIKSDLWSHIGQTPSLEHMGLLFTNRREVVFGNGVLPLQVSGIAQMTRSRKRTIIFLIC